MGRGGQEIKNQITMVTRKCRQLKIEKEDEKKIKPSKGVISVVWTLGLKQ